MDGATGELTPLPDNLPALTFGAACDLIPLLDNVAARIARLRGWAIDVIEDDCARNERSVVRIGDADWTYRGGTAYTVTDPAALRAALIAAGAPAQMIEEAVSENPPAPPSWRVHNGRINQLAKLGGAVLAAIRAHRSEDDTPARLEKKR